LILSGGVALDAWPKAGPAAPPLAWLGPALLGDLTRLPTPEQPELDIRWSTAHVRCAINTAQTVGRVLRAQSLAPAGASMPFASSRGRGAAVDEAPTPPRGSGPDVPEPPASPPVPQALSYSALAAWRACGYRFYLERVLRLPEEPLGAAASAEHRAPGAGATAPVESRLPDLDPRLRGTLVHALLEGKGPAAERVAAVAAQHGVRLSDADAADVARLGDAFAGSPLAERLARARAVHREHPFAVALGDTLLTGVVDVLAHERGAARLVVDYKTDWIDPGADLAAYAEQRYAIQRRAYALAALRSGARRVDVAYAFLERPGEPISERFEAADAERLEAQLLGLASGLLAGEYPVSDTPHRELCESCPGRRALCSHPEELTLRELP